MDEKLLSVADAAALLGVHRTRINQLIGKGDLAATRIGRAYVIREADLEKIKERPAPGRPTKLTDEEKAERAEKKSTEKGAQTLPFEEEVTIKAKPKRRASKRSSTKKASKRVRSKKASKKAMGN